ncbi:MAG: methyltransferase domain-containing protein [Candidatus Latescibacteria bacterium]|nr:methyltransferase domain-containing protein [Candidatus Latescibacterota bacterium]
MSAQLETVAQVGSADRFGRHDLAMYEYYDRNPPYDPARAALERTEEGLMVRRLQQVLAGRQALEIACGSGWATRLVAEVAASVVATDLSPTRLKLARRRQGPDRSRVRFLRADAYALDQVPGSFDAAYALAWFAHVPRERHQLFLDGLHQRVGRGGRVFLADERYNIGEDLECPGEQDSYELRCLDGGARYPIIDNKFDEAELRRIFGPGARDLVIHPGKDYWWLDYTIA